MAEKYRVLLIDDEKTQLEHIKNILDNSDLLEDCLESIDTRLIDPKKGAVDVAQEIGNNLYQWNIILSDLFMPTPEMGGLLIAGSIIEAVEDDPDIPIKLIVISNKEGAGGKMREYLPKFEKWMTFYAKPAVSEKDNSREDLFINPGLWTFAIGEAIKSLLNESKEEYSEDFEVSYSGKMQVARTSAKKIAQSATETTNVLLLGESGTGKEIFANYIHKNSPFDRKDLVSINCASIADPLLESMLFGYKKHAFTGAFKDQLGLFDQAQGSTIFLDEIGDASPAMLPKLLRVLDRKTREYIPVGGITNKKFTGMIIGATSKIISRDDILARFGNSNTIIIPPLRERLEDILPLANYFIAKYSRKYNVPKELSTEAELVLLRYKWEKKNVRALEGEIEAAVRDSDTRAIGLRNFSRCVMDSISKEENQRDSEVNIAEYPPDKFVLSIKKKMNIENETGLSKDEIRAKLISGIRTHRNNGMNIAKIAMNMGKDDDASGRSPRAFYDLLRKYNITTSDIKKSK